MNTIQKDPFFSGFVTLVGLPNVGKSSLMNAIIGEKIAIVSNRPQTTRNRIMGVFTEDNHQLVFLDTPGIHNPRSKLGEFMMQSVYGAGSSPIVNSTIGLPSSDTQCPKPFATQNSRNHLENFGCPTQSP